LISQSPLNIDIKPSRSELGHTADNARQSKQILSPNRISVATQSDLEKTLNGLSRTSGASNQATLDGPKLSQNGQPRISGVGNNLATDGPQNGDGNNLATDGPQNGDGNNLATDGPSQFEKLAKKWKEFSETHILPKSTKVSVLFNLISAPLRLLGQNNPIAKILNKLSGICTTIHQLGFAATGIGTGLFKKNIFYLISFGIEALAGILPLRKIYLFRGMAAALDILPTCVKKYTKNEFKNFGESLPKTCGAIWQAMKDFCQNPKKYFANKENRLELLNTQIPIIGAGLCILGNIVASFKDTLGGAIRDVGAILNDCALLFSGDKDGVRSGQYYLGGSVTDLGANIVGKYGQSQGSNNGKFGNIRDCIHELALASDRWGQMLFAKFLNKTKDQDEHKAQEPITTARQSTTVQNQEFKNNLSENFDAREMSFAA